MGFTRPLAAHGRARDAAARKRWPPPHPDPLASPPPRALQLVNVSRDGEEPKDMWEATEDMRLFAPETADKHGNPRECEGGPRHLLRRASRALPPIECSPMCDARAGPSSPRPLPPLSSEPVQ